MKKLLASFLTVSTIVGNAAHADMSKKYNKEASLTEAAVKLCNKENQTGKRFVWSYSIERAPWDTETSKTGLIIYDNHVFSLSNQSKKWGTGSDKFWNCKSVTLRGKMGIEETTYRQNAFMGMYILNTFRITTLYKKENGVINLYWRTDNSDNVSKRTYK